MPTEGRAAKFDPNCNQEDTAEQDLADIPKPVRALIERLVEQKKTDTQASFPALYDHTNESNVGVFGAEDCAARPPDPKPL